MLKGTTDKMVGFACDRTNGYKCEMKLFDLSDCANFEKKFPREWINAEGNNVTEDFAKYALPLIQGETKLEKEDGLPRFASGPDFPDRFFSFLLDIARKLV